MILYVKMKDELDMEQTYPYDIVEDDISDVENDCHDTGLLDGHNTYKSDVEALMWNKLKSYVSIKLNLRASKQKCLTSAQNY